MDLRHRRLGKKMPDHTCAPASLHLLPYNSVFKIESVKIILIDAVNKLFHIHLITCDQSMILVILAKHALESGINHRIVPNILGAAYIAGIRNFKGIYKFKGSCVLVHQILIVIRRSPLLGAVLCKPHRGPVKIWLGFADSYIIV